MNLDKIWKFIYKIIIINESYFNSINNNNIIFNKKIEIINIKRDE